VAVGASIKTLAEWEKAKASKTTKLKAGAAP
jgi:hypothetical protein